MSTTPAEPTRPEPASRAGILTVVLAYAMLAALWILLSDKAIEWLFTDPTQIVMASTIKGGLFVLVTSVLLYRLLRGMYAIMPDLTPPAAAPERRRSALSFALLAAAILALTASGIGYNFSQQRDKEVARLQAIAELRAQQITDWLHERLEDAGAVKDHGFFAANRQRWHAAGDQASRDRLQAQLDLWSRSQGFVSARLLETPAEDQPADPFGPPGIDRALQEAVRQTAADRQPRLAGPYRDPSGRLRLDFVAVLSRAAPSPLVVLQADPAAWLYPTLQAWPTPSASGETLIFRREGSQVRFLNPLRHRRDSAASLQRSVTASSLLAVQALRNPTRLGRLIEGVDYRGVAVLGIAQAVPGTDWFLIAKMDRAELYAGAVHEAVWIGLAGLLALLMAVAGAYLLRQRQQLAIAASVRQAQEARLQAQHLLAAIAEASNDAIFAKDLEGRYILFNQAASRFVGKPAEAVLGRDDSALFPADQAEMLMAIGRRVVAEDRLHTQEEALSTPDGDRVFLSTKGPLRDADGKVIGIFGISRDITERNLAESALRDSEGRFRALVEQSLAGIYIIQDDRFAYVNPGFAAIFGYDSPEALIDRVAVTDLVSPEDRALVAENVRRRVAGETSDLHYTFTGLRHDGSTIVVEVHGRAFAYRGRPAVIGLILDITARKAAEDSLRASELRFHDIVQASADWVWEVDPEGRYTYVSDSVQAILGYTPAEILGKTPFDLMPPEEAARVGRLFAGIAARREPFRDLDNLNRHKDGSLHHVQTSGMPIMGTEGTLLGYRGLDRDVTESKRAERVLHQRNEELERFNRATVGRELDMIALKQRINELSLRLGLAPPYPLDFVDAAGPDEQGPAP